MSRIRVVLSRSIYPRNVGMCARSMANMGVEQLILVAPRTQLGNKAKQGAAHAQQVLRSARIYDTFDEFLKNEGDGLRIALSGRDGQLKKPSYLNDTLELFKSEPDHPFHNSDVPIYLILGPEDDGLSNDDMELCHHICRLPTFGEITSLNLSHACLLTLFMVQTAQGLKPGPLATKQELLNSPAYYPTASIRGWLEALGFDLSAKRVNIEKTLNRILLSRAPTNEELRIVDSVLQQTVRKLRERTGPKS